MLRTILSIGLFAVLGLVALKLIFGIFGFAVGLFLWLLFAAIKIGIVGLVIYFIIRIGEHPHRLVHDALCPGTALVVTARAGSLTIQRLTPRHDGFPPRPRRR